MSNRFTDAFLLTRGQRQTKSGLEFTFWAASGQGPLKISIAGQEAVCFIGRDQEFGSGRRSQVELASMDGNPVDALYFASLQELRAARENAQNRRSLSLVAFLLCAYLPLLYGSRQFE